MSLVLSQSENGNNNQANLQNEISKEISSTVEHSSEKVQLSSENVPAIDPSILFPQSTMMKGILNSYLSGLTFLRLSLYAFSVSTSFDFFYIQSR